MSKNRVASSGWKSYLITAMEKNIYSIDTCPDFNFRECLAFLGRSSRECLFSIEGERLYHAVRIAGRYYALEISSGRGGLQVRVLNTRSGHTAREEIIAYLSAWLDFNRELSGFYRMGKDNRLIGLLVKRYRGLRLVGIADLWEALAWAIIGQQINLQFAYRLKRRLVKQWGDRWRHGAREYYFFPSPEKAAELSPEDLRAHQFSRAKAEYLIGMAGHFCNGDLSLPQLTQIGDYRAQRQKLMEFRGVGEWTADYVLMKCLRVPRAVPVGDAGLRAALKIQLGLAQAPSPEEIRRYAKQWGSWASYVTFYLWRSLI